MPQLWTETMVSQYFWLITILFTLYIIVATKIIPQIAYAMKSRQTLQDEASLSKSGVSSTALSSTRSFLSNILATKSPLASHGANYAPIFDKACTTWVSTISKSLK